MSSWKRAIGGCAVVAAVLALFLLGLGMFVSHRRSPNEQFRQATGLKWPETARLVARDDDHGGIMGEGEFYLILQADAATLGKWLAGPAPWAASWKRGPVPGELGFHCGFGTEGVGWGSTNGAPPEYTGDARLIRVLGSKDVWYAERNRCCDGMEWHNGDLLVLDPQSGKVWLAVWDF
ncbi:MAG TPA: hypothetical protein VK689_14130 [Armatimonadota bacterium]|nr:hypothetical protein [Armatimonadota bacterium]